MLTAIRALIAAMLFFNVLLIIYGIYRLNRPRTRPVSLFFKLLVWLLTRIDTNDLRQPPEAALLQRRQQYLLASRALGAGICGLVLASICIALGNAALLPQFPWSSADTMMLVRLEVMASLGMAGEVVGASIGGGIGDLLGKARLSRITPALLTSNEMRSRYADLISPYLRLSLWTIPLASALLVCAIFALIEQQPDMGLGRAVVMLWPLAVPPLLLILSALATALFGRQRYIPAELLPTETLSEWQRELIAQLSTVQRESDLRQVYDPGMSHLPLVIQMTLNISLVIPLTHPDVSQIAVLVLSFIPLGLLAMSAWVTKRFLPDTQLASLQSLQSAIPMAVPWRWHRPNLQ